jgi:hypothetical protein
MAQRAGVGRQRTTWLSNSVRFAARERFTKHYRQLRALYRRTLQF